LFVPYVKPIHRRLHALNHQALQGLHGSVHACANRHDLVLGEGRQDVLGRIHTRRRPADPNLQATELVSSQGGEYGDEAIVAARATFPLDAQAPQFQVQIIMNDDEVGR